MQRKDSVHAQSPSAALEYEASAGSAEGAPQRAVLEPLPAAVDQDASEQLNAACLQARRVSFFPTADCLTDDEVLAFSEGRVSEARREHVEAHMDGCTTCQQLVQWAAWDIDASLTESGAIGRVTTFSKGRVVAGRYRITRFIATGGMGEVYEAYDKKLSERVALKTMLCAASDSPSALKRLCHEVQLARRIAHPNVCRTHELHEHRDRKRARPPVHFVAMEFVDGETLGERLLRGAIPLEDAFVIARQLLSGLEAAHAAGVLHLDFKSANVMLRYGSHSTQAVIMDFSLSRAFETESLLLRKSERRLTGSAGYMSPEQLECQPKLGPTSDVYSFGVVLFEMLTGSSPFRGNSLSAIMMQQLRERPPAPSSLTPTLSPALDAFVLKCLSRAPGDRYPSIRAARAAFEELSRDGAAPRSETRTFWPVALIAAVVGLVLSTVYLARNEAPPQALEREVSTARVGSPKVAQPEPPPPQSAPPGSAPPGSPTPEAVPTAEQRPLSPAIEDRKSPAPLAARASSSRVEKSEAARTTRQHAAPQAPSAAPPAASDAAATARTLQHGLHAPLPAANGWTPTKAPPDFL